MGFALRNIIRQCRYVTYRRELDSKSLEKKSRSTMLSLLPYVENVAGVEKLDCNRNKSGRNAVANLYLFASPMVSYLLTQNWMVFALRNINKKLIANY